MAWISFAILILFVNYRVRSYENDTGIINGRQPKWFGWGWGIGIVRFENKYCVSTDGLDGTCYTRRQCRDLGGTTGGLCAGNVGYCCIIQQACGTTSSLNNTYFVNPGFPAPVSGAASCTYMIKRCNSDICQARIDFLTATIAPPDAMGLCVYDAIRITGGASVVRPICGENSGFHIYLGFNGNTDITISISTTAGYTLSRLWYIKVAQIECSSPTRAPNGCLMFYTANTGTVMSFNYGKTTSGEYYTTMIPNVPRLPGTRELAFLNYGVCVNMSPGFCSIEWSQSVAGVSASFAVTGDTPNAPNLPMQPDGPCLTDYVLIPNPDNIDPPRDRFCGNQFPNVRSSSKPFVLYVVTNSGERASETVITDNDIGNLGFSLNYRQIPCNPSMIASNP